MERGVHGRHRKDTATRRGRRQDPDRALMSPVEVVRELFAGGTSKTQG